MYTLTIIGGHGFWDKGDVYTGGVPKKDFAAAFSSQISFPPGCKIFFSAGGVLLVDKGVILQKIAPQGCQKDFFLPGL